MSEFTDLLDDYLWAKQLYDQDALSRHRRRNYAITDQYNAAKDALNAAFDNCGNSSGRIK